MGRSVLRRSVPVLVAVSAMWLAPRAAEADSPAVLQAGVYIYDGANPILVQDDGYPGYAIPTVVDWNNDGKKDLIVGEFDQGYIRLYLNQGTDSNPVFNGYSLIQSGGAPITQPFG